MSAHVLLNLLLNELRKRDKKRGWGKEMKCESG